MTDLMGNPIALFKQDWQQAKVLKDANAKYCSLATVSGNGEAAIRTLVLREVTEDAFVIFINNTSPKWADLTGDGSFELLIFWPLLMQQYRIRGECEMIPLEKMQKHWARKPYTSKILDHFYTDYQAQSSVIDSREVLLSGMDELREKYPAEDDVPFPENARGMAIKANYIEVWHSSAVNQLHERCVYVLEMGFGASAFWCPDVSVLRQSWKNIMIKNSLLTPMLSLACVVFAIAVILMLSLFFKIHEHPSWIDEGGVVETLTVCGYFLCALLMAFKGGWSYIKKYNYFLILVVFFGLRELDFDKKFTTMGILKSKFYLSDSVPLVEKLIGFLVILILLYVLVFIIKNHAGRFRHIKSLSPIHIGSLIIFLFLLFAKTIDGLARKLSSINIAIDEQAFLYFEVIEEVLELGIPLLLITIFLIYCSQRDQSKITYPPKTTG